MIDFFRKDIILENREVGRRIVLDTKWKPVDDSRPSDADVKQMFSYYHLFDADQAFLVYPGSGILKSKSGLFLNQEGQLSCGLVLVDVCSRDGLNRNMGHELQKLVPLSIINSKSV